jgi:nicotinamidase/pyrazinamidase
MSSPLRPPEPRSSEALLIVDVQKDFLPGGALPVPEGDRIISPLNSWLDQSERLGRTVFVTRDWHPPAHCSFRERGGFWPTHCVAGSPGARFADDLRLPPKAVIISKATDPRRDAYSGFDGTDLAARLRQAGVRRLFVAGLATEYCVHATAVDALKLGYSVSVIEDAVRAIVPSAGRRALDELVSLGAALLPAQAAV